MLGKLFGASKPKEAPKVDINATNEKLNNQIENIDIRAKKLEHQQEQLRKDAITFAKAGNKTKAAMTLKKSKLMDKEIAKLQGQAYILEQQKSLIENSKFDKETFDAMKVGKQAVEGNKIDMDQMDDLRNDIADQLADGEEVTDYFANIAQEGLDDAMADLDDLLAEDAMKEMDDIALPGTAVIQPKVGEKPVVNKPVAQAVEDDDDMEAMMAI